MRRSEYWRLPKRPATPLTKSTATSFPVLATSVTASTPFKYACNLRALYSADRDHVEAKDPKQPYSHTRGTRHLHQVQLPERYFGRHALAEPINNHSIPANPAEEQKYVLGLRPPEPQISVW
jgi:hypothetical protein